MNQKQKKYQDKIKKPVAWIAKMNKDKDWRWVSIHKSSVENIYDIVKPVYLEVNND